MRDFEGLVRDTAYGYGYWPDPDGRVHRAMGETMKQLRAWAQMADAKAAKWEREAH